VLVVAGPDGVGKSTLCDALITRLSAPVLHIHHRFCVLPQRDGQDHRERRLPPYPRWLSELKVVYLFCDQLLGWALRARPTIRRGAWVLIERGWWDLVVDPGRYRLHSRSRLARALSRYAPRPDLVIVLEGSPALLRDRKQELSMVELGRQVEAWRAVIPVGVRRLHIDTSLPAGDVEERVMLQITATAGDGRALPPGNR
jgi:thymidylate kinase